MMRKPGSAIATMLATLVLVSGIGTAARAQGLDALHALDGRASATLKASVRSLADSVARAGLPVAPLVDKTLEGISKGADDNRILMAVHGVANDLGVARRALGPSSGSELAAAVAALRAGSTPAGLAQLRKDLPGRQLVVPLSVLASLMVDGAPAPSALVAVVANAKQRDDASLLAYGRSVSHDIASGVSPTTAITATYSTPNSAPSLRPGVISTSAPAPPSSRPKPKP